MQVLRKILAGVLLAACVAAQAQTQADRPAAKTRAAKTGKTAKPKTQEQILLEQLNDKFKKLEDLNQKYEDLQQQYESLQQRFATRESELDQVKKNAAAAQADAAAARKMLETTEQAIGVNGSAVTTLQTEVQGLKTTSTSLTAEVQTQQHKTDALAHPESLHFRGIELTPGGFLAAETVNRQRSIGGDINTQFSAIPFTGQTAAVLSEFNASGRQAR